MRDLEVIRVSNAGMRVPKINMLRRWYIKLPLVVGILLWSLIAFHQNATVSADGMQYFVAKNHPSGCSDSYPGTIDQPWCTISKANSELNPGDTVFIREGIYEETIKPANSGSEGNAITYTSYQNEDVTIMHVWTGVDLDDRSYIHVNGINMEGVQILDDCCAEENIGKKCYDMSFWVRMENASHNILSNNRMKYAAAWSGIRMTGVSHHNKILNNKIIGGYKPNDLIYCTAACSDNLIEGNEIYYGAHQSICLNCTGSSESGTDRNVVRDNWIYNPWHTAIGVVANSDYTIVENNIILDCGEDYTNNCRGGASQTKGRLHHNGIQISSSHVIVRNNVVVNAGGGITLGSGTYNDIYKYSKDIRVYNNTLYENYRGLHSNDPSPSWVVGDVFLNNILSGSREYDVWSYIRSDPEEPDPERFFFNNFFSSGTSFCYGDNDGLRCFDTLQETEDALPLVFQNNSGLAPLFVDASERAFHLKAESRAIDAGMFLTRTQEAGTGTEMQVDDARYFTDGMGIIEGDQIQLEGQTQTARIIDVEYDKNIITVDIPLTWTSDQGVSLPYSGDAPDIGAYEFSDFPSPTFVDVPLDHWAYDYIEALYQADYVAGCNLDPLMYCPDATMTRAESAVFVARGVHGGGYLPDQPDHAVFEDVLLDEWFAKWSDRLWEDGYTAGCNITPLRFCPLAGHTRAEATVFFLRMLKGKDYLPPEPPEQIYDDVTLGIWYSKWIAAAHQEGLLQDCEDLENRLDNLFRPEQGLTRAEAACMMVRAKEGQNIIHANPSNYLSLLRLLKPGDTLLLEPGTYDDPNDVPGLPFFNIHGTPDQPIIVTGPEDGPRPVFLGRSSHNTVRFDNASYIILRNIEIDGRDLGGDGIKAQGVAHHITLENILIKGVGGNQQIVGISTKAPAWNWIIRGNNILGAGTGIYLGNSDGTDAFVNGLIEYNIILDTIGYNMQVKHQNGRENVAGMPTEDRTTVIRHNVFSKVNNASTGGMARPNLLVGHFPPTGPGSDDLYQIYGNFFFQNPSGEPLFQGEGNVALYNNLFVNHVGDAVWIQPHNDVPKMIRIFNNSVVASGRGIRVTGGAPGYQQKVIGNAVFAATPIQASDQQDNITDSYDAADDFLIEPFGELGTLDLYPEANRLNLGFMESGDLQSFVDWNLDFNGHVRSWIFRGAYAGEGFNPGWIPILDRKPRTATTSQTLQP